MAYREVTMLEVKEVLRLWLGGIPKKRIALQLGLDVKTVRRYVAAAWAGGLRREAGTGGTRRRVAHHGRRDGPAGHGPTPWRRLGRVYRPSRRH